MNIPAERLAHQVELTSDWALWRDFAVRSTGFGVDGLDAFGGPDEGERLADVARDPRFREAVAWQSREALRGGVDKLARGGEGPSRRKRREEVVAAYWQRYCVKNDTIGFFGPLGWGRFPEAGEDFELRAGPLESQRVVHFETWALEAVARALGYEVLLPMAAHPEHELRTVLNGNPGGVAALDRLEVARDAAAAASPQTLPAALDELDRIFTQITGRPGAHAEGESGGGRTIVYLDCMRELDLTVAPAVVEELRTTLPAVLEASRWWCGRVYARAGETLAQVTDGRDGQLAPLLGPLMGAAWGLHAQLGDEQRELQRRWAAVIDGDADGLTARAAAVFADHEPAWQHSVHHSVDVQIAARDADALRSGDFLIVLGDFHGGANPLMQGLFANRHPEPGAIAARAVAEIGPRIQLLPPRTGPVDMSARLYPVYNEGDVVITTGDEPAPAGTRGVPIGNMVIANGEVSDRGGTFELPLTELLFVPIFISGVRSFELVGDEVTDRVTLGRTVIRRARWTAHAGDLTQTPDALTAWARERDLPRRVFARSPLERKPRFVDFESPALCRVLQRWCAGIAASDPGVPLELTEMLPGPEDCWLEDEAGRHTSELRLIAVDLSRLPA